MGGAVTTSLPLDGIFVHPRGLCETEEIGHYVSLRSMPKPSHGVATTGVLNPALNSASRARIGRHAFPHRRIVATVARCRRRATVLQLPGRPSSAATQRAGSFFTKTLIQLNGMNLGNIEIWKATVDGRPLRSVDRNFWGVAFARDDDTFCATAASGSMICLMRGSIKEKSTVSLRTDAECPSLSPNSNRLLYGLPRPRSEATTFDLWVVRAVGTGAPTVFIPEAFSPAVVR